jgi:hypothetical protein
MKEAMFRSCPTTSFLALLKAASVDSFLETLEVFLTSHCDNYWEIFMRLGSSLRVIKFILNKSAGLMLEEQL